MIKTDKEELLIGLIGDTHIRSKDIKILDFIINDFKKRKIDYLIHTGDFTSYNIYIELQNVFGKEKVIGISGNMDDSKISKELPEKVDLVLFRHNILITHGSGGPHNIIERLNRRYDLSKYDIIIFGHTHHPFNKKWRDGKLYISPGTPTDKRFTDTNSYGYLKISKDIIEPKIIII